ncbi:MAG: hypothetical protein J07HB67_01246 [halophilic archaeon J07HB67]|jgi:hypothetical protein|nr:MAG: hypothetical protein J07HB67_01246 [halophilic archaeon J07HB67]
MAYNESLLTGAAFAAAGLSGLAALVAVGRSRASTGAAGDALAGAALAATVWAVAFGLRLSADTPQASMVWLRVGYVVAAPVPTLLLVFALYQTGNARVVDSRSRRCWRSSRRSRRRWPRPTRSTPATSPERRR